MFNREFYPLSELAARWGCTVGDLLHLGIQDRAQICVNIYGLATGIRQTRLNEELADAEPEIEPQTDEERREAAEADAAVAMWESRTTRDMPHGIFELEPDDVRFIEMPNGLPYELYDAMKFDRSSWWEVKFDPPITIDLGHLVMLREEVDRLEAILKSKKQGDAVSSPTSRDHISNKLARMNQAAARFWGNADRADRATHPDNAIVAAWLIDHDFSPTLASKAATIIRPEWAPVGRKPEE